MAFALELDDLAVMLETEQDGRREDTAAYQNMIAIQWQVTDFDHCPAGDLHGKISMSEADTTEIAQHI